MNYELWIVNCELWIVNYEFFPYIYTIKIISNNLIYEQVKFISQIVNGEGQM